MQEPVSSSKRKSEKGIVKPKVANELEAGLDFHLGTRLLVVSKGYM